MHFATMFIAVNWTTSYVMLVVALEVTVDSSCDTDIKSNTSTLRHLFDRFKTMKTREDKKAKGLKTYILLR